MELPIPSGNRKRSRRPYGFTLIELMMSEGYLRQIPIDPITGAPDWVEVPEDALQAVNQEGRPYSEWR